MNLMLSLLERLPQSELSGFQMVLTEEHHKHKKDSPSGSARRILEVVKGRGYEKIPTHVTRAGGVVGVHTVKLFSDEEELQITHRVENRSVFAKGALLGASFIGQTGRKPGVYRMQDVFELEEK